MFYGGLLLAAAGAAGLAAGLWMYRARKRALDVQLNREYGSPEAPDHSEKTENR